MDFSFTVDVPRPEKGKYRSNYISTTKYNLLTFLPLALILQFKRYANIYFLVEAILQSIPLISPLNPASAVAPLAFVLGLSMLREGVEDYRRWRSDQTDNSQLANIYTFKFEECKWKDIKGGDFIKIKKEEVIPADFVLLLSSSPSGIAYVETSSLDG
jgi:magnesium-transporting ATPase (P-type)